jgi:hypothetical protein
LLKREAQHLEALIPKLKGYQSWAVFLRLGDAVQALEQAHTALGQAVPYAVHARCGGQGCPDCRNQGYVPEWRHFELCQQGVW